MGRVVLREGRCASCSRCRSGRRSKQASRDPLAAPARRPAQAQPRLGPIAHRRATLPRQASHPIPLTHPGFSHISRLYRYGGAGGYAADRAQKIETSRDERVAKAVKTLTPLLFQRLLPEPRACRRNFSVRAGHGSAARGFEPSGATPMGTEASQRLANLVQVGGTRHQLSSAPERLCGYQESYDADMGAWAEP